MRSTAAVLFGSPGGGGPTVPGAPTGVSAVGGNAQATVSFTPPADGGEPITGYTVTSSPGGFTGTGAGSPIVVTGLSNGTEYTFTVTATNSIGTGSASAPSNAVTPATVPGAPTIGTATGGNAQASVTFTAPASNGGSAITGYTVTSSPGGFTGTGASSPIVVTGLSNGTPYTFTVTATNAVGTGSASAASNSVTPAAPLTPTLVGGFSGAGANNYTTGSFTADAASVTYKICLNIARGSGSTLPDITAVSGMNLTWTLETNNSYDNAGAGRAKMQVWTATGVATTGALTLTGSTTAGMDLVLIKMDRSTAPVVNTAAGTAAPENCAVTTPSAGKYLVGVVANVAFSGSITLDGTYASIQARTGASSGQGTYITVGWKSAVGNETTFNNTVPAPANGWGIIHSAY